MSRKNHVMNIDNQAELTKTELIEQIEEVEKINRSSLNNSSLTNQMHHPKAFYKSRSFDFKDQRILMIIMKHMKIYQAKYIQEIH
ncbi:unnamed protein product [Rhizophagus irregularis]|nr:unnamed protein product [Rhizophagus irregularis]